MTGFGAEQRYDLAALEFQVVRDLLAEHLTTALGRTAVEGLLPMSEAMGANRALGEAQALAVRFGREDRVPMAGVSEVRSWLAGELDSGGRGHDGGLGEIDRGGSGA